MVAQDSLVNVKYEHAFPRCERGYMLKDYIMKRTVVTLILFLVVLNVQFAVFWVINPIKPVQFVLDPDFTPEVAERLTKLYGLDQPLHVQYAKYITNMVTLNFGMSFRSQLPVAQMIMEYLPNTLALVLTALIIQMVTGIMIGLYAATKRGKLADLLLTGAGMIMYAMPPFIMLLLFRYIFAEKLLWFPVIGIIVSPSDNLLYLSEFLYRMALPLITLVCMGFSSWTFYTRNLSMNVISEDFIQMAKAKGVSERSIMLKHVFRAILPPIITLVILSLPAVIFGSIVTEYVFTWKGIGWWYLNSIWGGDYPVVQALFFIYTIMLLVGNFLSDILYGSLDPRIRVGVRR